MNDANDPERLPRDYRPAIVQLLDGTELFVAHQRLQDCGWLWLLGWQGTRRRIPPQRIKHVESVQTDRQETDDQRALKTITDPDLVEQAREAAGLDDSEPDERREVSA